MTTSTIMYIRAYKESKGDGRLATMAIESHCLVVPTPCRNDLIFLKFTWYNVQ